MIGVVVEKKGWIYVDIQNAPEWGLPTFFLLVDEMFKRIRKVYEENPRRVVFDVLKLEYVDSTVVSLFLQSARMTVLDRNAIIVGKQHTRDLLHLLGMDKLFDMYATEKDWEKNTTDTKE